jgi:tRNA 2-selenouridine synthase
MAITRLNITEFLRKSQEGFLIDVRSPSEYRHAHMPGAYSLPLFNDEERKLVGTSYKQQSRENAIKIGLDFFGPKMRSMVDQVELWMKELAMDPKQTSVFVHCWRGGMRSAGVAWLLDLYGFKVFTLHGGYKAFRGYINEQLNAHYKINILGGRTGAGKTMFLKNAATQNLQVLDLEGLANHKGSSFGKTSGEQPTQEAFENLLGLALAKVSVNKAIWVEDESARIGDVQVPINFWNQMRAAKVYYVDIPFEERLQYLEQDYSTVPTDDLRSATNRIAKRLGGLETKNVLNYLTEENRKEAFRILLRYYDKWYDLGLQKRGQENIIRFEFESHDVFDWKKLTHGEN